MLDVTLWHNPRCSKSREALALLDGRDDVRVTQRRYLDDPPALAELRGLLAALGLDDAREIMRANETVYRELDLAAAGQDALLEAVTTHPILLQRPIAAAGEHAVLGRPPERVLDVLR